MGKMWKFLLLYAITLPAVAAEYTQSATSFEAAVSNISTSPSYVMVTIADANTGLERQICTTANFLAGAIHFEYGLGNDHAGLKRATELALSNTSHRFVFTTQAALDNMRIDFSPQDLDNVRTWLAPVSNQDLMAGAHPWTQRESPYYAHRYRDAVACVLIERGLSPYQADLSGQVVVAGSKNIPVHAPAQAPVHH